jgi:hypothetical protein
VAEHAIPRDAVGPHYFPLGVLIAARDAPRVALGRLHLGPAPVKLVLSLVTPGALIRTAPLLLAVRVHRSSIRSKLAFSPAYHLITE